MTTHIFSEILEGLYDNTIVPYLGSGVLFDAKNKQTGAPMPADSHSLILSGTKTGQKLPWSISHQTVW